MNPHRNLTIRLMIATAFLMLIGLVGALASLGGDDTAAAWGKALLSVPIFALLFVFLYVVWKADLPHLWRELAEYLVAWQTLPEEQGAERQRQVAPRAPHASASTRTSHSLASPAAPTRYWVRNGTHRHQQLTPEEMAAELERLLPLATQAGEAQRSAQRAEAALAQLQAQVAEVQAEQQAMLNEQAEVLAAQWCRDVLAHWYAVLCAPTEVPHDPNEAFHVVCVEMVRLRETATQAEAQATRMAEMEEALQTRDGELASIQQHLNTVRQRLDAVREVFGLSADVPLVEGARQIQAERQRLTNELEEATQVCQERDTLRQQVQIEQDSLRRSQARITELETLLDQISRWEELSDADLIAFWGSVNYGDETIPERWPRRIEQRLRAELISLVRLRTERTELALSAGEESAKPTPPPPVLKPLPPMSGGDKTAQHATHDEEGEGVGPDSSSAQFGQFGQFGVRQERSVPVRPRCRRPSMGHY